MTVQLNGAPANPQDLEQLTATDFGCFTSMQVRAGSVRGLGRHLQRLHDNSLELFGAAPDAHALQQQIGQAAGGRPDCSVRAMLVCLDPTALLSGSIVVPDVVVQVGPPRESSTAPLRVRTVAYERETPWIKHRATHGLIREIRAAHMQGYDDALFVDRTGNLSEGSTWNLCVHDGRSWVWPEAMVLNGITQQLIQQAMGDAGIAFTTRPVSASDAPELTAAFAMNATSPYRPVVAIDGHELRTDPVRAEEIARIWDSVAPEAL